MTKTIWIKTTAIIVAAFAMTACDSFSESLGIKESEKKQYTVRIVDPGLIEDEHLPEHLRRDYLTVTEGETATIWPEVGGLGGLAEIVSVSGCGNLSPVEEVQHPDGGYTPAHWVTGPITADCTVTITYRSLLPDFYLVKTRPSSYGGSISPQALTVIDGGSATFLVEPINGYEADITGCNGELMGDRYIVSSTTGNCTIDARFKPRTSNTLSVAVTHSEGGSIPFSDFTIGHGETLSIPIYPGAGYTPDIASAGCSGQLVDAGIPYVEAYLYETQPINQACTIDVIFHEDNPDNTRISIRFNNGMAHRIESYYYANDESSNFHHSNIASVPVGNGHNQATYRIYPEPGYDIVGVTTCTDSDQVFLNQYPPTINVYGYSDDCDIVVNTQAAPHRDFFPDSMRVMIWNENESLATLLYTNGDMMDDSLCDYCVMQTLIHPRLWGTAIQFMVDAPEGVEFGADYCVEDIFGDTATSRFDDPFTCQSIRVNPYQSYDF